MFRALMAVFIRVRDIGGVVTDLQERVSQGRVHVARALVGIAAFVLNFAGLYTPNPDGYCKETGSR
jgi:hypothetical protein